MPHAAAVPICTLLAGVAGSQEETQSGTATVLLTIDILLVGAGAVVLLMWVVRWWRHGRRDPLAQAAMRPNTMVPELLLIPLGVYLGLAFLLQGLNQPDSSDAMSHTTQMNLGNAVQLAGLLACLAVARMAFTGGTRAFLWGRSRLSHALASAWWMWLVALCVCSALVWVTAEVLIRFGYSLPMHPTLEALAHEAPSLGATAALCVGAVVIAPIAEECFFRGLLQTVLSNLLGSRWRAIGLSAAVFALMHSDQAHAVPPLAALAVILGYAYERHGSLLVPILLHVAFNLRTIAWQLLLNSTTG